MSYTNTLKSGSTQAAEIDISSCACWRSLWWAGLTSPTQDHRNCNKRYDADPPRSLFSIGHFKVILRSSEVTTHSLSFRSCDSGGPSLSWHALQSWGSQLTRVTLRSRAALWKGSEGRITRSDFMWWGQSSILYHTHTHAHTTTCRHRQRSKAKSTYSSYLIASHDKLHSMCVTAKKELYSMLYFYWTVWTSLSPWPLTSHSVCIYLSTQLKKHPM